MHYYAKANNYRDYSNMLKILDSKGYTWASRHNLLNSFGSDYFHNYNYTYVAYDPSYKTVISFSDEDYEMRVSNDPNYIKCTLLLRDKEELE